MWGKFQKLPDFSINFDKNEFFGTRKCFQNSELNDVLPTDGFQNRQNPKTGAKLLSGVFQAICSKIVKTQKKPNRWSARVKKP